MAYVKYVNSINFLKPIEFFNNPAFSFFKFLKSQIKNKFSVYIYLHIR